MKRVNIRRWLEGGGLFETITLEVYNRAHELLTWHLVEVPSFALSARSKREKRVVRYKRVRCPNPFMVIAYRLLFKQTNALGIDKRVLRPTAKYEDG